MLLVRHGPTNWSDQGRHTGRTDVRLNAEGRRQADSLAQRLAGLAGTATVVTSPLARAAETCALAGLAAGAETDQDLAEWDYGAYEGRTTPEIRAERPGWSLWTDGVPDGETLAQVAARADRVIARARERGGLTVCFGHGHTLRVLGARWADLDPAQGRRLALYPAHVSRLGWEREVAVLSCWNEAPGPPR
jgi:probable phosphoglycerate mutase